MVIKVYGINICAFLEERFAKKWIAGATGSKLGAEFQRILKSDFCSQKGDEEKKSKPGNPEEDKG